MPRPQHKNKKLNSQDNMPSTDVNNPVVICNKINLAKSQDQDFKIGIMNMFKNLKEDINK